MKLDGHGVASQRLSILKVLTSSGPAGAMFTKLSTLLFVVAVGLTLPSEALVARKTASPITLPFARRLNFTGTANLLQLDQARAQALKDHAMTRPGKFSRTPVINVPATNQVVDHVAVVCSCRLVLTPYFVESDTILGQSRQSSYRMQVLRL